MRILVVLWWLILSACSTSAQGWTDQTWFESLPLDSRVALQRQLILTGDYSGFADGQFGPATAAAIRQFQALHGNLSPIPSNHSLQLLAAEANTVSKRLGVSPVNDAAATVSLDLPLALLTNHDRAPDGSSYYVNTDRTLLVTVFGFASEGATLAELRSAILNDKEFDGEITYEALRARYFVVSGTFTDHKFYSYFSTEGARFIGFRVEWDEVLDDTAATTIGLAASSIRSGELKLAEPGIPADSPDKVLPGPPPYRSYTTAGDRIGAFLLPANSPSTIILDGDLTLNSQLDFLRALRLRPEARLLLLNSDGGLVVPALVIAHEVNTRGMGTKVEPDRGCYSACAYIFFAGKTRTDAGLLGVHQIHGTASTQEDTQMSLSDVLDALHDFDVPQEVVSVMLRTPPNQIHVFGPEEIASLSINRPSTSSIGGADGIDPDEARQMVLDAARSANDLDLGI